MTNQLSPTSVLTLADMQAQLAPYSYQTYLTGVRVPELFSADLILELSVEIYGEASAEPPADAEQDDGLEFSLAEAEAILEQEIEEEEGPVFPVQRWDIVAKGVTEKHFELGLDVVPELNNASARLLRSQLPQVALMFAAAPASKTALLVSLFEVHDQPAWGEFGKYGLGGDLSFGCGVFAEGPKPLMERYAAVLEAHGMRPSLLDLPPEEQPEPPAQCLLLDDEAAYVLADSFEVLRRADQDTQA